MIQQTIGAIQLPLKRIHIELTNVCNFECTFCPKFKMTREYGFMETGLAKKIIAEIADEKLAEKITFHIMGEPFMHKGLPEILALAKEKGLPVGITTNGAFLSEKAAHLVAASGVSQVNISLQTPNEKSFETRVARGMTYEQFENNILSFIKTCRSIAPHMKLKLHFLNTTYAKKIEKITGPLPVMKGKEEIRSNLIRWAELICSEIGFTDLAPIRNTLGALSAHQWNVVEVIPGIFFETYILNSWGDGLRNDDEIVETSFGYCSALQDHFGILWDGRIVFCCKDYDGKTASNLNASSFSLREALGSPGIQKVVEGFKNYRVVHPHCKRCLGGTSRLGALAGALSSIFFWKILKSYFYKETASFPPEK